MAITFTPKPKATEATEGPGVTKGYKIITSKEGKEVLVPLALTGSAQVQEPQSIAAPQVAVAAVPQVVQGTVVKTTTEALVEELIHLEKQAIAVGAKLIIERQDEIKKKLQGIMEESGQAPDAEYTFDIAAGKVVYSPCRKTVEITDKDTLVNLLQAIKPNLALELATFKVTDLKKYVAPAAMDTFSEVKFGSRSIKAILPKVDGE